MLSLVFDAVKGAKPVWVYAALSVIWVLFLILLDLGVFVVSGKNAGSPAREESEVVSSSQTGCLDIDGVKICD
ncbi:MAG: hypothetical protein AAFW68_09720 [Pseudomonadota bacterium]